MVNVTQLPVAATGLFQKAEEELFSLETPGAVLVCMGGPTGSLTFYLIISLRSGGTFIDPTLLACIRKKKHNL